MHRTENVELTVLCLITDGAKCCFKIDLGSDYDLTCGNLRHEEMLFMRSFDL